MFYTGWSKTRICLTWLPVTIFIIGYMLKGFYSGEYKSFGDVSSLLIVVVAFLTHWAAHMNAKIKHDRKGGRCTSTVVGRVDSMRQSKLQIGDQWLLDVHVSYLDQTQEIKRVEPDMHYIAPPGSRIPLRYNPKKPEEVIIDYDALRDGNWQNSDSATESHPSSGSFTSSNGNAGGVNAEDILKQAFSSSQSGNTRIIDGGTTVINASDDPEVAELVAQLKRQYGKSDQSRSDTEEGQKAKADPSSASAMIQIESITPRFDKGANVYEIKGTVYRAGSSGGERVRITQELQPSLAGEVVPGRVLQCHYDNGDYTISLG